MNERTGKKLIYSKKSVNPAYTIRNVCFLTNKFHRQEQPLEKNVFRFFSCLYCNILFE